MNLIAENLECKTQAGKTIKAEMLVEGWWGLRDCAKMLGTQAPVSIWNVYTKLPVGDDVQLVHTKKPEGKDWARVTIIEPLSEMFKEYETPTETEV